LQNNVYKNLVPRRFQDRVPAPVPVAQAIACSLENPESCEACQ